MADTGQLTVTRAEAEPPHKEAVLPPRPQAPAGNLKVLHTHSTAEKDTAKTTCYHGLTGTISVSNLITVTVFPLFPRLAAGC